MEYSLLEAAKVARVNKSTVLRAIKSGRLSARREERGTYRIDASELARVFDLRHLATGAPPAAEGAMPQSATAEATGGTTFASQDVEVAVEVAVLRERVRSLETDRERWERERETILERERMTADDLRKRLDRAEERILALSVQPVSPVPSAAPEPLAVVDELRKRVMELEARNLILSAVTGPQWAEEPPEEAPAEMSAKMSSAGRVRSFLGRLLGR